MTQIISTRTQTDRNNAAFMDAFRRGDSAGLAAVYTEDAEILPPNAPVLRGRAAIQAYWQGALDQGVSEAVLETVEFDELGDSAWEVGKGVLKTKDGELIDELKYTVIWKREHGTWKWQRDIWNSSRSPAA